MNAQMRTIAVIFVLALLAIAAEIYSDILLTRDEAAHSAAPDPATAAVAHGFKPRLTGSDGRRGTFRTARSAAAALAGRHNSSSSPA
jgi:hypothetical protein